MLVTITIKKIYMQTVADIKDIAKLLAKLFLFVCIFVTILVTDNLVKRFLKNNLPQITWPRF